jgi:hypothetical protein
MIEKYVLPTYLLPLLNVHLISVYLATPPIIWFDLPHNRHCNSFVPIRPVCFACDRYDFLACSTGSCVIPCCGFDSIPRYASRPHPPHLRSLLLLSLAIISTRNAAAQKLTYAPHSCSCSFAWGLVT